MANVRISQLPTATAENLAVVPSTNAAGTTTGKLTLQAIVGLPHTHQIADVTGLQGALDSQVTSDVATAGGGAVISNIVSITQADYDAIVSKDPGTLYVVQ